MDVLALLVGKVEGGEFAVIFFCGLVVCLCGLDLVFEVADRKGFAVGGYSDGPGFFPIVPTDAFVF